MASGLTHRELRQFGLVMAAALVVVFGLALPWLFGRAFPIWPYAVAGALIALALAVPSALSPLHRGWMKVGHVLGWVNTRIILSALFFVLFVPIGFVMRLLGKDTIAKGRDPEAESYRIDSTRSVDPKTILSASVIGGCLAALRATERRAQRACDPRASNDFIHGKRPAARSFPC